MVILNGMQACQSRNTLPSGTVPGSSVTTTAESNVITTAGSKMTAAQSSRTSAATPGTPVLGKSGAGHVEVGVVAVVSFVLVVVLL